MQPIKILVIEDSPLAMLAAKRIMAKMGHQADFVIHAEMALMLHYEHQYDVILCDLRLPTMSSFSMALKIRSCERKYGLRNTKIIFMASVDQRDIKTALLAMGVDELLIKPLQAQCVMSLIELCQTQVVNV